jgi:hypothetical protein
LVLRKIVDAVRHCFAQFLVHEVVDEHFVGLALWLPFPAAFNSRPRVPGLTGCPCRVSWLASCVVLLHVQRNGDVGSPRVMGSTNRSSAAANSGSTSVARLRPAPGLRTRDSTGVSGSFSRASSSARPFAIVFGHIPVARLTARTPPQPYDLASAAAHCRRIRSSISEAQATNRDSIL